MQLSIADQPNSKLPASRVANAATQNDMIIDGPASSLATDPART